MPMFRFSIFVKWTKRIVMNIVCIFCLIFAFIVRFTWNTAIANNSISSAILEIKTCKIVKIVIFRSLSREHFQSDLKLKM